MNLDSKFSRRNFLKTASALTAASALPGVWLSSTGLSSCSSGPRKPKFVSPNDKVNLACVGIGNRGGEIIREFNKTGLCNIVALCDVDMGAPQTQENMKLFPNAKQYKGIGRAHD